MAPLVKKGAVCMRKDTYIFPAILDFADDGISIEFPDLPGCLPCAHSQEEALKNAREAMGLHLYGMEDDNDPIPEPSEISNIELEPNQKVILVDVWMPVVRDRLNNKSVNRTVTVPAWLNRMAMDAKINFSQALQDTLRSRLGV